MPIKFRAIVKQDFSINILAAGLELEGCPVFTERPVTYWPNTVEYLGKQSRTGKNDHSAEILLNADNLFATL